MEKYQIEGVPMEVYTKFKERINHPIELQLFRDSIWEDEDKTKEENIEATKEYQRLHILQAIIHSWHAEVKSHRGTLYCMSGFIEQEGRFPTINDDIRIIKGRYYFDMIGDGYITSEVGFEIVRNKNT